MDNLPRPAVIVLVYSLAWGVRFVTFMLAAALFTRLYLWSQVSQKSFATYPVVMALCDRCARVKLASAKRPGIISQEGS